MRFLRPAIFISGVRKFWQCDIGFSCRLHLLHGRCVKAPPDNSNPLVSNNLETIFPPRLAGFFRLHLIIRKARTALLSKDKTPVCIQLGAQRSKSVDVLTMDIGSDFSGAIAKHGDRRYALINRRRLLHIHQEDVFKASRGDVLQILERCNKHAALRPAGNRPRDANPTLGKEPVGDNAHLHLAERFLKIDRSGAVRNDDQNAGALGQHRYIRAEETVFGCSGNQIKTFENFRRLIAGADMENAAAGNNILCGLNNTGAPVIGKNANRFQRPGRKFSKKRFKPLQFIFVRGEVLKIRHDNAFNAVELKAEIISDTLKESRRTGNEINAYQSAALAVEIFARPYRERIQTRRIDHCIHAPAKARCNIESRRNDQRSGRPSALQF